MLDTPNVVALFRTLIPFVSDSIWLGKLNRARSCIQERTSEIETAIRQVEAAQTDDRIWDVYQALKDEPLVRWKESIKQIVGLSLAERAGMDV